MSENVNNSNSKYGIERGEYVKEKEDAQVPIRER